MKLSILFWLRASAANAKGIAPLMIRLTLPNKDISEFASGHKVDVNLWDKDLKKVKGKSPEAERVNLYIIKSTAKLCKIYTTLEDDERDISTEIIKNIYNGKGQEKVTILRAIDDHNTRFREIIEKTGEGQETTIKKFENLKIKLVRFLKEKRNINRDYSVNDMDNAFIEDFRDWLLLSGHTDGGPLSKDSATGHLKKLNKITLNLYKRKQIRNNPFVGIKLKWQDPTAEGITHTDLLKLERLSLKVPRLQKALDRFLVGCYSGMSHSDISKAKRNDVVQQPGVEGNWISTHRKKTGEYCMILILPRLQALIDKYWFDPQCIESNSLFPTVGNQSCNEYLKEIAVFAGIEKNLTTHTARHTFAQIAMNIGVPVDAIAAILGHASTKTTKSTYAKTSHFYVANQYEKLKDFMAPKPRD